MLSNSADVPQVFDLPIHPGNSVLSHERKSSIQRALRNYRARVLELNMAALNSAIEALEQETRPIHFSFRSTHVSPDELPKQRIESLRERYGIYLNPPDPTIMMVRDLLSEDRRENLVRTCRLDGISHGEIDHAARKAWIEKTETKIMAVDRTHGRPDGLPAELKYLMSLVHGLCGPGLPNDRFLGELHKPKFISDIEGDEDEEEEQTDCGHVSVPISEEDMSSTTITEKEKYSEIDAEWDGCEVGLAVVTGNGGFAVYCRRGPATMVILIARGAGNMAYGLEVQCTRAHCTIPLKNSSNSMLR